MSMVTATTWVPRGFAAPFPTKYVFDEEEFERISKLAKLQLDDAKEELEEARENAKAENSEAKSTSKKEGSSNGVNALKSNDEIDDDLKEYDMENYDTDSGKEDEGDTMGMFGNIKSLVYHEREGESGPDPYVTLPNADDDDDAEEREALQILATDNLVLAARVEDEVAHLEVYVYEDDADNLYVHHDIMLPAIPLAVEWLDLPVGKGAETKPDGRGSYVAVGTMDPDIELWDLDTVDCMYPNAILGEGGSAASSSSAKKSLKKKKKKPRKPNDTHHVDAVLALAANRSHRNLLASASADATVKLWDLSTLACARSYGTLHSDKVCALAWHPRESAVLLSGSYDRTVAAADARAPDATPRRWRVESDVESVRWDPHDANFFYIATEAGAVHCHDARNGTTTISSSTSTPKPLWTLQAHAEAVSAFDANPAIPGFLVTGSTDREVKIWNVDPSSASGGPSMVTSRNLGVGRVFSATFAPDAEVAFRLAVAGSKGAVQVWDTSTNAAVRRAFAGRVAGGGAKVAAEGARERVVGVEEDEDEDESSGAEGEEEEEGKEGKGADDGWESMSE